MFFALMPTESGDAISSSIDCAIEQLYKFLHVRLVARVGIIDRSHAFKNGLMDSTVFANNAKLIITCFEHLLFAGKCPGTKDVQDSIQLILKQLHKCTSDMMVRAIFVADCVHCHLDSSRYIMLSPRLRPSLSPRLSLSVGPAVCATVGPAVRAPVGPAVPAPFSPADQVVAGLQLHVYILLAGA